MDVLCNMSGIFRDSFANVVDLLDDLFQRAAAAPEPPEQNFIRKHALAMQVGFRACDRSVLIAAFYWADVYYWVYSQINVGYPASRDLASAGVLGKATGNSVHVNALHYLTKCAHESSSMEQRIHPPASLSAPQSGLPSLYTSTAGYHLETCLDRTGEALPRCCCVPDPRGRALPTPARACSATPRATTAAW